MSSLEKCLFSSQAHFLIALFIFLKLSCRCCLYIFEISCLSVASFAIIFSHSEGCLFILLIVSFVVQKLLILIRSHLFIFAFISNILGGGSWRHLMSSCRLMFPGVRSSLVFSGFGLKPPASGFQSYSYSILKTSSPFEDNGLFFWVPDVLCHRSEVVLCNLLSV